MGLRNRVLLSSSSFRGPDGVRTVAEISESLPEAKFLFDVHHVDNILAADHLNGGVAGYNNAPLFSINRNSGPKHVDISLIQCFFGKNHLQTKAVENALRFTSLSDPRPVDWVFVEAQRNEGDAKFKWVVNLGAKYVFVRIENDRQDYFIKEQLWNIGTLHAKTDNLVFVDADVAYCQSDWLRSVEGTFREGCQLFQPHAWSWRASEPDGFKGAAMRINYLNLTESFAHMRKIDKPLCNFNGHTGYDIAISRRHYKNVGGFYSLTCTGGDFLIWSLLANDKFIVGHPLENLMRKIVGKHPIPVVKIGCSDLSCFHLHHGSADVREKMYGTDVDIIKSSSTPEKYVTNNFGMDGIAEVGE